MAFDTTKIGMAEVAHKGRTHYKHQLLSQAKYSRATPSPGAVPRIIARS